MQLTHLRNLTIILGSATAYFVMLAAPDITWINTGADGSVFIWSALQGFENGLGLLHPTGAPVYSLLNGLIAIDQPSIQVLAHRLALSSAIASTATTVLIYHITKRWLAPLLFASSILVVSQSTIPEMYALLTLLMVTMYATRNSKWFIPTSIIAVGIHHLVAAALIPLLIYRRNWWDTLVLLGGLWYLILPFAVKPDVSWSTISWYSYFTSQGFMFFGLSPEDKGLDRIQDFVLLALITVTPIGLRVAKQWKTNWLLFSLTVTPFIYYGTQLIPQAFVYVMPGCAFAAILIGQTDFKLRHTYILALWSVTMIVFNITHMDIGHNLDPAPTTARQYLDQVQTLPEGSIVYAPHGWERIATWLGREVRAYSRPSDTNPGVFPTHIAVMVDPTTYRVDLRSCDTEPSCSNWWRGNK